jgi:hypothetical protein
VKWKLIYIKIVGIYKKVRKSIYHQCISNYQKIKGKIRKIVKIAKIHKYSNNEQQRENKRKRFYILSMETQ